MDSKEISRVGYSFFLSPVLTNKEVGPSGVKLGCRADFSLGQFCEPISFDQAYREVCPNGILNRSNNDFTQRRTKKAKKKKENGG